MCTSHTAQAEQVECVLKILKVEHYYKVLGKELQRKTLKRRPPSSIAQDKHSDQPV